MQSSTAAIVAWSMNNMETDFSALFMLQATIAAVKDWEWGYSQRTCVFQALTWSIVFEVYSAHTVQLLAIKWQINKDSLNN